MASLNKTEDMKAILLDFNGTLFFDTCFHQEAWSKIYREFHGENAQVPGTAVFCGPCNDVIIQMIAPELTKEERWKCSVHKEAVYREICGRHPEQVHLMAGAEELLSRLKAQKIPMILATASIPDNVDFYFRTFRLDRWFDRNLCVYDDGTYANKGEMYLESARRLGVSLSDCIVVEDSAGSIACAKEIGTGMIIGIGTDLIHPELIRAGATHCIRDFTEFNLEWLRN